MAEDLWKLRKRRGLTVSQLANKSGVPALSIQEYEQGNPIRVADLARLSKALFVDEFDIKIQSTPKTPSQPRASATSPPAGQKQPPPPAPIKPKSPPEPPAKPTQVTHLLELASKLDQDEAAVQDAAGKPLDQLSLSEARELLNTYTEQIKEQKYQAEKNRPEGTRRKRAHLPEGIDEYELNYLTSCQENGDPLTFYLLNGESFSGRVLGFSPYHITIDQGDGVELTLHKLALAYYMRTLSSTDSGEEHK